MQSLSDHLNNDYMKRRPICFKPTLYLKICKNKINFYLWHSVSLERQYVTFDVSLPQAFKKIVEMGRFNHILKYGHFTRPLLIICSFMILFFEFRLVSCKEIGKAGIHQ